MIIKPIKVPVLSDSIAKNVGRTNKLSIKMNVAIINKNRYIILLIAPYCSVPKA